MAAEDVRTDVVKTLAVAGGQIETTMGACSYGHAIVERTANGTRTGFW